MRTSLILSALLTAATGAQAQTFPTPDPVIKRIYSLGMDSSHTRSLAHVLFDSVGPRLQGTPDLKRAQDWLVSVYRSWGIDAREERYGTWRGWIRGPSHIDLIAPRVRTLQGQMVGYSPGTGGKRKEYEVVVLPRFQDSTEFVQWLPQAKGKLVMISAGLPTCRPQDDWAANATPESKARMDSVMVATQREWTALRASPNNRSQTPAGLGVRGTGYFVALGGGELGVRLEQGGAGGIITSRPKLSWTMGGGRTPQQAVQAATVAGRGGFGAGALNTGWGAMEVFETYNTRTPAIALDCEDYGLVFRLAESGYRPRLALNLEAKLLGEQPVYNVMAQIPGKQADEFVMLSAHYDSWDGSSGATDNGTGTLTMLEAMRILKLAYPNPARTILVGHWSGEEEGEVGSKAFTEDHPEVLAGLQALFNQDNGTGRIRNIGGGGLVHSPEHINAWVGKLPTEWRDVLNFSGPGRPAGGGSDDFPFGCRGLPAFGLGSLGWDYGSVTWHTERDTFDKVVFDDLKFNATLTAMLAYLASEDPDRIPLDRVDLATAAAALRAAQQARVDSLRATDPAAATALQQQLANAGRFGGGGGTWPVCVKAPRSTEPRLR